MTRAWAMLVAVLVATASGCVVVHVDRNGVKHIFGMGYVRIEAGERSEPAVGELVAITSVGVLVTRTPYESSLAVGYNQMSQLALQNNACALLKTESRTSRSLEKYAHGLTDLEEVQR